MLGLEITMGLKCSWRGGSRSRPSTTEELVNESLFGLVYFFQLSKFRREYVVDLRSLTELRQLEEIDEPKQGLVDKFKHRLDKYLALIPDQPHVKESSNTDLQKE